MNLRNLFLSCAMPLLVLNILLSFGNQWPGVWPKLEWRLSLELAVLVLGISLWASWYGSVSERLRTALAALTSTWVVLHYIDITVPAIFGRKVNIYWDGQHLWSVLKMNGEHTTVAEFALQVVLPVVLGLAALYLLHRLIKACIEPLADGARVRGQRRMLISLSAGVCALWFAGPAAPRWLQPEFAPPVSARVAEQSLFLRAALSPAHHERHLGASPDFSGNLSALEGADVLIVFAEAYGAITFDKPEIAAALEEPRNALASAIEGSGRHAVSARVSSPTFGGASWRAHSSLLAGIDTTDPGTYPLLLTSSRPTLISHFSANGYRTVGWMPGLQRPWPEGAFYGFDRHADANNMGYTGLHFGFWRIPDQASMALIHRQELSREHAPDAAPGTTDDRPRLIVFPTVTTHAPFRAIPPLLDDWSGLLAADPLAYREDMLEAALNVPVSWSNPTPAFVASMHYQFGWLASYLKNHAPAGLLTIVIGDHQPIGSVSGPDATWDVPVHVISHDRQLLARLEAAGFVSGLEPATAPIGPMHSLTPQLVKLFHAEGSSADARVN